MEGVGAGPRPKVGAGGARSSPELPQLGRGGAAREEWDEVKVSRLLRKWPGGEGGECNEGLREEGRGADGSLFGALEWLLVKEMAGQAS